MASHVNGQQKIWHQYDLGSSYQPLIVNKITQDPYGRMWMGTTRGLLNFDGDEFNAGNLPDSASQNVTAVFCDSQYVYLGFEDGKLMHRSIRIWNRNYILDGKVPSPVISIHADRSKRTWVATYGSGLYIITGDSMLHIDTEQGLPGNEIYTMLAAEEGTVWIGTDGGLTRCVLQEGKVTLTNFSIQQGLPDEIVRCLAMDEQQNIWIGTQDHGIFVYNVAKNQFESPAFSHNWNNGPVISLAIKDHNRMMIGTLGKGLVTISLHDNFFPIYYNQSTGYENIKATDIAIDSEGNFWVVSPSRGLDQFPALFEWIPQIPEQTGKAVQAVYYDSNNALWYATYDGLFKTVFDSTGTKITQRIQLSNAARQPIITSIYEDIQHEMWIGTFDGGVFLRPAGKQQFLQILQRDGIANDNVLSVSGDMVNVWIATLGGITRCNIQMGIENKSDLILKNFTNKSGLHSNYLYQTFIDAKGRVWFATDGNGLIMFDNDVFTTFDKAGEKDIKSVYSITEDPFGNIWFSTPTSGLFRYDGSTFANFTLQSGLSSLNITGITTDANGDIVVIENDAVDILEHKASQVRRYRSRQIFDGIAPNLNAFCRDRFGNVWIATKKGILKYYTPSKDFSHEAQVEIRQVMVYLKPINDSLVHRFRHDQNHIAFDFQAFWNSDPSQLRYRYKLGGHDLDWITTKDERAIYPELSPGTYTFIIQASIHHNFDDAPTASYVFTIEEPFWATWWFILGCLILLSMLVVFLIRERDRQREREEKLRRERIEFQFENLKSQLNPHFLFNSFNTLATLIEENQEVALSYIDNLSDFYRSILSYKDVDLVTVEEELHLTNNYIFLLKERHGDRLHVTLDIPEWLRQRKVPPLTLQLLIENAVKHNIVSREQPLEVEIFTMDKQRICVRNKLQLKKEVQSTGFGLQNIRARCELLGSKYFEVTKTKTHFQVCVPLFDT